MRETHRQVSGMERQGDYKQWFGPEESVLTGAEEEAQVHQPQIHGALTLPARWSQMQHTVACLVKSVFKAPVPAYCLAQAFALSAQAVREVERS